MVSGNSSRGIEREVQQIYVCAAEHMRCAI
jgi:hypothetical protein